MSDIGLWTIAAHSPDRTAAIEPDGTVVSYAELAARADQLGRGLRALGLAPGATVAGMLPNGADALALFFAALETGLYVVPVNWHLTAAEVAYNLGDSEAGAFIAHERFAGVASAAADQAGIDPRARFAVGEIGGFSPISELGKDGSGRPGERTTGAPMLYTSGTSGRPKGVRRALTGEDPDAVPPFTAWFFAIFGLKPHDGHVHLCCSPLYHTAVLNFATISSTLGHPVALMDRFVRARYDVSSLRCMIHAAAPCPPEVKRRMIDWWGPVVTEYYAATEGGGSVITAQERLDRPGSVGTAWPGSEVRVLDDNGDDAPTGEPGLIYLRMGASTFDYYKDKAKTLASRARGMFTVGDIGYLDADGYLYLCDRKGDMIISGGVNIYPAEIESELSCHPAVDDVAVFGIPNQEWGEEIKAVAQPARGIAVDYVAELPRDPNGKLYKRRLRDPYWAARDKSI